MMTSLLAAPSVLLPLGVQEPRIRAVPPSVTSAGEDAIGAYELTGGCLNPWQASVLLDSLGERADGRWAAFEVGLVVARQNGKDEVLLARELAGLFIWHERLIIHSAHKFDTAMEHLERLADLIHEVPEFRKRIRKVNRSHGQEGITLRDGARIRFRARTRSGGGRGYTADCVIFNEAMDLPDALVGSIMPTLSARSKLVPGPQIWLTGSAVDQETMPNGLVLARVREAGIAGANERLAYFEWSADDDADPHDWLARSRANPSLGFQISHEHVETEFQSPSMSARQFGIERLGIGDWPDTSDDPDRVISVEAWGACSCSDASKRIVGPKTFAVDVAPQEAFGSIAVSGKRDDGLFHVAVVEHKAGTHWMKPMLRGLLAERGSRLVGERTGPAAAVVQDLIDDGLMSEKDVVSSREYAQMCAEFFNAVAERLLRYPVPQPDLDSALASARTTPLEGAWKWSRKNSTSADISPLIAATHAVGGARRKKVRSRVINPNDFL